MEQVQKYDPNVNRLNRLCSGVRLSRQPKHL